MCLSIIAESHNHHLLCNVLPRTALTNYSGLHLTPAAHTAALCVQHTSETSAKSAQVPICAVAWRDEQHKHQLRALPYTLGSMHKACTCAFEQNPLPMLFTCRAGIDRDYTIPCSVCEAVPGRHGPLCSSQCRLLLPLPGCQPLQPCLCPATPATGETPSAGSAIAGHFEQYVFYHHSITVYRCHITACSASISHIN